MSVISRPSGRAAFRVAILCPRPRDAHAIKLLFDFIYDETSSDKYGVVQGDPNKYTLGRIGRYDVVLVHMPQPGKVAASSVTGHIKLSYPGIEIAFLIGTCGEVPNGGEPGALEGRKDVFLGDVVISEGIVQCDLGKRHPGRFTRKNTVKSNLGRPNQSIRSFLAQLRMWHDRLTDNHKSYLVKIQNGLKITSPGVEKDILFRPSYRHGENCQCDLNACENESVVDRRRLVCQSPFIHFGLLASGDTIMSSAKYRDRISKREDVVAFKMEGAGKSTLMKYLLLNKKKTEPDAIQEHQYDIRKYVETNVQGGSSKAIQDLREEICERANGVFL
ncbi:hypothetical protein BO71DRAFT_468737 [Aspergillus ellipticus CBS 707.79]|uniref:Uncharacterized protein n=1 Tax=Aspergillus ellipticus CBS 707.79 TaxID=1448320 RepID=A0A319EAY9_9EURO|nr:hypothetical protein BO71DRAFT_468737 [Aspergillus ellipticus CBS 707.79]